MEAQKWGLSGVADSERGEIFITGLNATVPIPNNRLYERVRFVLRIHINNKKSDLKHPSRNADKKFVNK